MHKPEYLLLNETYELHWDFEKKTDHLISAKRPDLVTINKEIELAEKWSLQFWPTTEWNWKKTKREINTKTLPEN